LTTYPRSKFVTCTPGLSAAQIIETITTAKMLSNELADGDRRRLIRVASLT